jgi:hypothetical protein
MTGSVPPSVQRELRRLEPGDPVVSMVELVFEIDDPAVTTAVVRRLLTEAQRGRAERQCNATEATD